MTEDRLYDTKCGCTLPLKVAATTFFFSNLYMGTQCFLQGWITRVAVPQMLAQAIPGIYMLFVLDEAGVPSVAKRVYLEPESRGFHFRAEP